MKLSAIAWLCVVVAFCARLRAEETITIDGAIVPLAEGWTRADKDDSVVLTPLKLPAGVTCSFTLLGGEAFAGPIKDQMDVEWKGFEGLGTMGSDSGISITGEGTALEIAGRSGRIDNSGKQSAFVLLFVVKTNGRLEKMVLVTNNAEALQKYAGDVAGMVNGAKFFVPKVPEQLSGVCLGFAKVKTHLEPECWIFLANGVVFRGFPYGGPAEMNLESQLSRQAGVAGEYKAEGNDVLVTMKGEKEATRFSIAKGAWTAAVTRDFQDRRSGARGNTIATWTEKVPTTLRLTRALPCDDLKLSGTYKSELAVRTSALTIQFTADGQFTDGGLVHEIDPGILKEGGGRVQSPAPEKGGRGKYAIGKNTLTLSYENGVKLSLTFLATAAELERRVPEGVYVDRAKLVLVP